MASQIVGATEFKAKCLALLDEVDQHGGSITITKRGRAVAILGPAKKKRAPKSLWNRWAGKGHEVVDLASLDTSDLWDVVREK